MTTPYTAIVIAVAKRLGVHATGALRRVGCETLDDIPTLTQPAQVALCATLHRIEAWRSRQGLIRAYARGIGLTPPKERTV